MSNPTVSRRDFLAAAAAVGYAAMRPAGAFALAPAAPASVTLPPGAGRNKIDTFDYQGVTLSKSLLQKQFQAARDFYFSVSDDDILHGYRGQNSPGRALGGWCASNSDTVLGQWMQGMSRIYRATGDTAMRDKAIHLITEWAKATGPDNATGIHRHYPFEKIVGGLVDLKFYAGHDAALGLLDKVISVATDALDRTRTPASPRPWANHSGRPGEWYTLGENLYRAHQLTGNDKYREFAEVWLYTPFWNKFLQDPPQDAWGVHAYSHVNSFSSCAMAYAVSGDDKYLQILKNAYDFLQNTQCFATGGYGPVERLLPPNGNLGVSIEDRQNSCEVPCCSWAALKMARYLMTFTGEARYGDWIERILYNAIGSALPITENGKNFYYADYRLPGGTKTYARSTYTCCSGTYIQAVTEYHNILYFKDANSLYVNIYLPSEVTWNRGGAGGAVKVVQETSYPEAETSTLTLSGGGRFALKFRIPGWSNGVTLKVNGTAANAECKPGTWATIDRDWANGDKVEIRIPLAFRYQAVDKQHPDRVAVVRGPVVMVQDASVHEPIFGLPANDEELNKVLVPSGAGQRDTGLPPPPTSNFALLLTGKNALDPTAANSPGRGGGGPPEAGARFMPFYAVLEVNAYRMYFDRKDAPKILW